jgi:hypothetical protein
MMDVQPGQEDAILSRYNGFMSTELSRMKTLKKKGLLKLSSRKFKEHGARVATSGMNIDKLCGLIFECDLQFFIARLDDDYDRDQTLYISHIFEGGEAINQTLESTVATIDDVDIKLGTVQSLAPGFVFDKIGMNALIHLFSERDEQVCNAYELVNKKKVAYKPRQKSLFVSSNVVDVIFSTEVNTSAVVSSPEISAMIQNQSFLCHYRIILPLFWSVKNEWLLIVVEPMSKEVHIVFTKYKSPEVSASSTDERVAMKTFIYERLKEVLKLAESVDHTQVQHPIREQELFDDDDDDQDDPPTAIAVPGTTTNTSSPTTALPSAMATTDANSQATTAIPPVATTVRPVRRTRAAALEWRCIFQNPHAQIRASNHRTPDTMNTYVELQTDSGLYVAFAIECDYYDAPIYAADSDWSVLRKKFAYWLVNGQLMI